jgi:hypothetical protein
MWPGIYLASCQCQKQIITKSDSFRHQHLVLHPPQSGSKNLNPAFRSQIYLPIAIYLDTILNFKKYV